MAVRPPIANVIKMEWTWTCSGVPLANILHVGYSSAPPIPGDLVDMAGQAGVEIADFYLTALNPDYVLVEVICTDLSSDTGNVGSFSSGVAGSNSDPPISAGSSLMVNWQIARRYRGGKPRTYLPPMTSYRLATPSTWDETALSETSTFITNLRSAMEHTTYGDLVLTTLGAVSYVNAHVARVDPVFYPFTGFAIGNLVRTQRRRINSSTF